jgi:hypothetical protein
MNLIILFFSLIASPLLKYKFDKMVNDVYSGCDGRYPMNENSITELTFSEDDQILIAKIGKYFIYKDFLKTLENDKVSINNKLRVIENNNLLHLDDSSKYVTNLLAGGLMDDFNFEL